MAGNKQQVVHWNEGSGPAVAITGVAWPRRWPRRALARSESRYKRRRGSRGPHWVDGAPTLRISRPCHVPRVAASLSARPGAGRRPWLSVSCLSRLSSATMMVSDALTLWRWKGVASRQSTTWGNVPRPPSVAAVYGKETLVRPSEKQVLNVCVRSQQKFRARDMQRCAWLTGQAFAGNRYYSTCQIH